MNPKQIPQKILRRLILGWLIAVSVEFLLVLPELSQVQGLAQMSLLRVVGITLAVSGLLWLNKWEVAERYAIVGVLALLLCASLATSFTFPFFQACLLIMACGVFYALFGWNGQAPANKQALSWRSGSWAFPLATGAMALGFFWFVSAWTVARVESFSTPSYDFGIFSQMFYSMRTHGEPITTLERDGALSHFAVHVSPTYYLLLPFYALLPKPATLQVLQAAVLASSVIPLWLIGKQHGLPGPIRTLLCGLLLLYPAFSGGTSYDIHENCFLTPCLLWLLYGIDRKNYWLIAISALVTLGVKEDAAVYVAVVALYLLLRSALHRDGKGAIVGGSLLLASLSWFFAATWYLSAKGDGVMTYRYNNFMYDGNGSLLTVVKAVLMCPMKAVYECMDPEKLKFLAQTMLPLLGLPLITRRYERYVLLIPYLLVNLMSDYQYQHNILFQYTFGSTACLFYLMAVNLEDLKSHWTQLSALGAALVVSAVFFGSAVMPTATSYMERNTTYEAYFDQVEATLDTIPDGASVTATTFYTTYLSQRDVLYDVGYCSREHLFSTDYVVLNTGADSSCKQYGGVNGLITLMKNQGYTLHAEMSGTLVIYKKPV